MRKDATSSRARKSRPMWYSAAADYARKKLGTQAGANLANRTTIEGQDQLRNFPGLGNRLTFNRSPASPSGTAENVNGKNNRRRSLNSPLKGGYPVSRACPAPQVVDMQALNWAELPILKSPLIVTLSSASSVKSPAAKRLAAAIVSDRANGGKGENISMDSLQETMLPLIMVEPNSKPISNHARKESTTLLQSETDSKRTLGAGNNNLKPEVSPKPKIQAIEEAEESTEIAHMQDPVEPSIIEGTTEMAAEPTVKQVREKVSASIPEKESVFVPEANNERERESVSIPQKESVFEPDANSEREREPVSIRDPIFEQDANYEADDNGFRQPQKIGEGLEIECKSLADALYSCFPSGSPSTDDLTDIHDECNNPDNILTSCALTEAHYLSLPCEDLNQTNAGQDTPCKLCNFPQFSMAQYMCPRQTRSPSCVDASHQTPFNNNDYRQTQSEPRTNFNGHMCCNHGTCWPRQGYMSQQMQMPCNSCFSMCCEEQVPTKQQQQGLTELLAQQLRQQMEQAQLQIAQVQRQLNSACCAPAMQKMQPCGCKIGKSNSATLMHTVIESEQELEVCHNTLPRSSGQMPERVIDRPRFQFNQLPLQQIGAPPISISVKSAQSLQVEESDRESQSDGEGSSLSQSEPLYSPPLQCACQQQQRRQQQSFQHQHSIHTPQYPGNHFNCQPCCWQRYAQMRFKMSNYWQSY